MRKSFSNLALTAVLGLAITFTLSCSGGDDDGGGGSCNVGRTVKIGNQTWMAENLNCNVNGSKCYKNDPSYCAEYGRLYDWETAKKVCPSGWHLPSESDWDELINYVESDNGCSSCAGKYLKSKSGWSSVGNGTDDYEFSALPGGDYNGYDKNYYLGIGNYGVWWSATDYNTLNAYYRAIIYNVDDVESDIPNGKKNLASVRCVQD